MRLFRAVQLAACVTMVGLVPGVEAGQSAPRTERPVLEQPAPSVVLANDPDARETRERLKALLEKYPPGLGRVLKLDPSLMMNQGYLATYPALAAFLAQHPEVAHNPGYFLENINVPSEPRVMDARLEAVRMWEGMVQGFAIFCVFLTITAAIIWLVRMLVEYRRWYRVSKVQAEVHNKLLDRFTANEDLLAYIQTPAGRRFLESAPVPLDSPARPLAAPFTRILWSVQAGLVLAAAAIGLLFVSGRVIEDVAQPIFAVGVLALAVGAGFVLSAAVSFLLSRHLGLFEPAAAAREQSGSTGTS